MDPAPTGPGATSKTASRLVWAGLVGVLAVVSGAGLMSLSKRPPQSASALQGLQVLGQVPDFQLTERSGADVGLADLRGKVWVADFIFTRCAGTCPLLTSRLARLQEKLGVEGDPDLRLVSFSVDPSHDTPQILAKYADSHGASASGWLFLTGPHDALYDLIKDGFRLSVAERDGPDADPNEMITHSDRFVLVDRQGRIRGYYHGTEDESVSRLVDDVAQLRKEQG